MNDHFLKTKGVNHVYVTYSDLHGITRGKLLSVAAYRQRSEFGLGNCCGVFSKDVTGTPVLATEILWEHGASDNRLCPCPESMRMAPWLTGCATMVADVFKPNGEPLSVSPRYILKRVIEQFHTATGCLPVVGYELEFSLLNQAQQFVSHGTQAYSIHQMTKAAQPLDALVAALVDFDMPLESLVAENSDGQYEISLRHCDALTMADHLFQTKHLIKEVAQRAGYNASFMAVPRNGVAPNSLHVNVSLPDHDNGFQVVDGRPSATMARCIAGLLHGANDALPLFLPTVNAFKAPYANSFFPHSASWGLDNRSVLVRVPVQSGKGCRLEFRLPTSDANPYLALSGVLALMMKGIVNETSLADPVMGNAFEREDLPRLDFRFDHALERLERQSWLSDVLGASFMSTFLIVKHQEDKLFKAHVTDWERRTYETFF